MKKLASVIVFVSMFFLSGCAAETFEQAAPSTTDVVEMENTTPAEQPIAEESKPAETQPVAEAVTPPEAQPPVEDIMEPALYSKFVFFQNYVLYAEYKGDTLRFAPTIEALKDAAPIMGVSSKDGMVFKDFPIPLPAGSVPEGVSARGRFSFRESGPMSITTYAKVDLLATDEQGEKWTYVVRAGAGVDKNMIPIPEEAPEVEVFFPIPINLVADAQYRDGKIYVGAMLGDTIPPIDGILHRGSPAQVRVAIIDAEGNEAASRSGTLKAMRFNREGESEFGIAVDKPGGYTCKILFDAGPAGNYEAEMPVTVPGVPAAAPEPAVTAPETPVTSPEAPVTTPETPVTLEQPLTVF